MHILQVFMHVKADRLEEFARVAERNATASIQEPGIARFDLLQQSDDPTRFMLFEAYRTPEDAVKHKDTEHYRRWAREVEPLLAEPRTRLTYINIFPDDSGWG